ncbi:hypothetical protein K470DRAFT_272044 [Piedraia hortae CBS 480.64]|uniref:DUF659 domain-containing protein n=1 Tax=Piedraia hortae CBS 480.64 TaxID=1314780 RepID=A0A6A7BV74_9PEZI|nr:hypothetical protein K470DRAFT_272044 [Piedraia hortae CBS 480.64]
MLVNPDGRAFARILQEAISTLQSTFWEELQKVVGEVGLEHINAISTDTAPNIRKAVRLLLVNYPQIYPIGCNFHQFDLLIKDILKFPRFSKELTEAVELAMFCDDMPLVGLVGCPLGRAFTKVVDDS